MAGSLLQLRGSEPSATPLVDARGNVLCFNGEIFSGLQGLSLHGRGLDPSPYQLKLSALHEKGGAG
jgi:hypothetical protein